VVVTVGAVSVNAPFCEKLAPGTVAVDVALLGIVSATGPVMGVPAFTEIEVTPAVAAAGGRIWK